MDSYTNWLKNTKQTLFETGGTYWRLYQNALVPASLKPEPVELNAEQANELLGKSGALFLRYFTRTSETPTAFWYTACDGYSFEGLPRKVRSQIRRAYKDCRIERVDPAWVADNGYNCYTVAFLRYQNARPESKADFDEMCRGSADGPFEFWAAFVGNELAGFAKYAMGNDYAAGLVIKLDPRFLSLGPSSALQDTILKTYVTDQRRTVFGGFRSVVHDTKIHDFLLRFGYRRIYCDLKLVYRPSVHALVKLSYPLRSLVDHTPESNWSNNIRAFLLQEEIRRSFEIDGKPTSRSCEPILNQIVRSIRGNRYGTTVK
jgi:hypothetical protein